MEIWIGRHGQAEDPDQACDDFSRKLTCPGRQQILEIGSFLSNRRLIPDEIWHSPLCRAEETAAAYATCWGNVPKLVVTEELAPGMSAHRLVAAMARSVADVVLCVGHQPDVSRAVSELAGGARIEFAPGTVVGIELNDSFSTHSSFLKWAISPAWFPLQFGT